MLGFYDRKSKPDEFSARKTMANLEGWATNLLKKAGLSVASSAASATPKAPSWQSEKKEMVPVHFVEKADLASTIFFLLEEIIEPASTSTLTAVQTVVFQQWLERLMLLPGTIPGSIR